MKESIKTVLLFFILGIAMAGGMKIIDYTFKPEARLYICSADDTIKGTEKCKVFE